MTHFKCEHFCLIGGDRAKYQSKKPLPIVVEQQPIYLLTFTCKIWKKLPVLVCKPREKALANSRRVVVLINADTIIYSKTWETHFQWEHSCLIGQQATRAKHPNGGVVADTSASTYCAKDSARCGGYSYISKLFS